MISDRLLPFRVMTTLAAIVCVTQVVVGIEWEDQSIYRLHKEPPHATKMPYPDQESALIKQRMESDYCRLLNGQWKYHWSRRPDERPFDFYLTDFDDSDWDTIRVPANVEIEGYGTPIYTNARYPFVRDAPRVMGEPPEGWTTYRDRNPISSYRLRFTVPDEWAGRQTFIVFNGVESAFYLWCNGKQVGYSQDSRTPAEFNLTRYLKEGENLLAVEVYRFSDGSYLEDQDFWRLSGIFRDVYLWSAAELDLRDFEIGAGLDDQYEDGELMVHTWTKNYGDEAQAYTVEAKLLGDDDQPLAELVISGNAPAGGEHQGEDTAVVPGISHWSAETPKLYRLLMTLKNAAGEPVAYYSRNIGFRTSEIKNGNLLINGKPVFIKGVDRHDHNHLTGHYITEESMRDDLNQMKRLNVNAIRTSHYPNDPRFAELVDEYGFYMASEANIETHGYGRNGNPLPKDMSWLEAHLDRIRNNVELHKNHACAVIWSMGNEAGDGPVFAECLDWIHHRDPSRPVQYENALVSDYRPHTAVDIFTPMYYRIRAIPRWVEREEEKPSEEQRPFIQCEYSHSMGNSCGGLADYWDLYRENRLAQGGFIWDWRDQGLLQGEHTEQLLADLSPNKLPIRVEGELSSDDGLTEGFVSVEQEDALELPTAVTLVADVNIASNTGNNPILCKGDSSYALKTNGAGDLEFFVYDGEWRSVTAPLGESWLESWRRVAGSFDGEMLRLFVDGREVASEEFAGAIEQNEAPLGIGHDAEHADRRFDGRIRQAAVYSRALTADEIGQPGELPGEAMVFGVDLRQAERAADEEESFFAFGGDFGDVPNDDNFCMNGVVAADCSPNPHAHEVFQQYRNILVEPLDVAEPTVRLNVTNEMFFRDIEGQPYRWQLLENGEPVGEGRGNLPSCPPQESVEITIETGAEPRSDAEYVLTVEFEQGADRPWAAADYVVAREQAMLPWGERPVAAHEAEGAVTIRGEDRIVVEGDGFAARFDAATGQLFSYEVDGSERLAGPLRLNFWRPPTDNDRGNGMPRRQRVWRSAGDGATATATTHEVAEGVGRLAFDLGVPAEQSTARVEYDVFADGAIEVRVTFRPAGDDLPDLPRVGMQCQISGRLSNWTWYGRGPWENYVDRKTGAYLGIHSGSVDDLWHRYSEPQETANRTDVRWASFTAGDERGIRFVSADEQLLEVGAYPFDQSDLEGKRHPTDIPNRDYITVHVAHAQMGVAGEDSWGARPLRKYTLPADREYRYAFRIEPIR